MKPGRVGLRMPDRFVTVSAIVGNGWAAHKHYLSIDEVWDVSIDEVWDVTHIDTGYRLPDHVIGAELTKREAVAIAKALSHEFGAVDFGDDLHKPAGHEWKAKIEAVAAMALESL